MSVKQLENPHRLPDDKPPEPKGVDQTITGQVLNNTARIVIIEGELKKIWARLPYRGFERLLLFAILLVLCMILGKLWDLVDAVRQLR